MEKEKKLREKKSGKEKKKRLSFRRSVSNILFALRQVWEVSASYFIVYYLVTLLYAPLDFFSGSYLIRVIVSGVEEQRPAGRIVGYILVIGGISLVINIVTSFYWNIVLPGMHVRIGAHVQKKLFRKASQVELACYETPAFYDKYVKAMDEAYERVMKVMSTLDDLIWRLVSLFCNAALIFVIDPFLIVFGLLPLLLGFVRRWDNRLKHEHSVARKPVERRQKYVRRTFYLNEYSKEMRIGRMRLRMLDEITQVFRDLRELQLKYGWKRALAEFIKDTGVEVVTILGATAYSVWRTVSDGSMSIADCIVILNSIGTISYCLSNMVQTFADFGEHALFLDDIRYFLDYEPKMPENPDAPEAPAGCADIDLKNVSFRYEGAEKDTLQDISLHIGAGERVALVGLNGSGKTTLVKLILRLYDPTGGTVALGGTDVREYRLSSYRDRFTCVFQDFKTFSMSVKDNVLLRLPREGDDGLVEAALKESGAWEKIQSLDKGTETTLTREFDENGANLSVGEQQKVALGRAFACPAPCIILDEPSSALDPVAEHTMFTNMMRAAEGKTVLFISHRLSSAVDADCIFLMEDGRITETGTHTELMHKNGRYAEMFRLQAENYVGGEVTAQ